MSPFAGFPPGKTPIDLPAGFFTDMLPLVDDLGELKILLFCFWALRQKQGPYPYLRRRDFAGDEALMRGLAVSAPESSPDALLDAALERAVSHGILLRAEVLLNGEVEALYFAHTRRGRTAVKQIQAGGWKPGDLHNPVEILPERPNLYSLYEANVGALTPMIADALKDATQDYPPAWIEEAITLAVEHNKRNWRYIQAVLKRWETEGKSYGFAGRPDEPKERRYITGNLADFIEE